VISKTYGFLAIQLMISAGQQASVRLKFVNQRLRMMNSDDPQDLVYSKMKRMRGIKHDNQIHALHAWINRLVIQSGLPLGSYGIYAIMLGLGGIKRLSSYQKR